MTLFQPDKNWHGLSVKKVFEALESSKAGLSQEEAELRLEKFGPNAFYKKESPHFLRLVWRQIKSPLVFILLVAGLATLVLRAYTDSVVILIAVVINTAIGVFQEGKASRSLDKLKESQKKYATVLRGGKKQMILFDKVVPGDVLILSAGDQVAADARLIDCRGLEINEAVLTGEWMASSKRKGKLKESVSVPDRENMVWMGTLVTEGWAEALVVSTGFNTEFGKIARMVGEETPPLTPFQKSVKKLARFLSFFILGALVFIFAIGVFRGESAATMFFTSVAIAVAAIPEGLPVAVSVVLAIGMERILSKGGLVKKLNAAETLGSVDVILTDKTGTLTQALMRVSDILTLDYLQKKEKGKQKTDAGGFLGKDSDREVVLEMAILASSAFVENPEDPLSDWVVRGQPLEQALLIAGMESGIYSHGVLEKQKRIDFLPFDPERRFAASLNKISKTKNRLFISGAPEYILGLSRRVYKNGKIVGLSEETGHFLRDAMEKQTAIGARVIGVAYREGGWKEFPRDNDHVFEDFIFGGFVVFHDPLRPDVSRSLEKAKMAGIKTVMMTGDHKKTARKISDEVGITKDGRVEEVVEGGFLEKWSDKKLAERVGSIKVFARVLPHQKLRIVKAWQGQNKTVAMTGDGINDAPSLRRAEVGIALNSGTEVAKEASEIVLLNNSFSVIISAIEEGRKILVNLRKILVYLLSTGFSEIVLIAFSLVVGLPLPILPAQILWINLIEEGFMNFAFAFEPKEKDLMKMRPGSFAAKKLLTPESKTLIIILAIFTSILLIFLFLVLYLFLGYTIEYSRTIVFGALSIDSIFFAFSLKNFRKPIWKINIFSNTYLLAAILISLLFLFGALFVPQLRFLLSLEKIGWSVTSIIIGAGFLNLFAIETAKHFLIKKTK